jgi:iron complex transport system ATP-binding protein
MSAVAIADVSVFYNGRCAVAGVDLDVGSGEWVVLVGPNGAGKSSLLRAVTGTVEYEGRILFDGNDRRGLGRRQSARQVALVPQNPVLPPGMRCREYVLLGRNPHMGYWDMEKVQDRRASLEALRRLSAEDLADRVLGSLSGGERQRIVLARAIAQEAPVLLLDEPTTGLDIGHQQQVLDLVEDLRREEGITVLGALHDLTMAAQYADRLALMDEGRLVAQGDGSEILTPERLAHFSGARVAVVRGPDGQVVVIPRRAQRA